MEYEDCMVSAQDMIVEAVDGLCGEPSLTRPFSFVGDLVAMNKYSPNLDGFQFWRNEAYWL